MECSLPHEDFHCDSNVEVAEAARSRVAEQASLEEACAKHVIGEGPDFSTLPVELLYSIAVSAARVFRFEKVPDFARLYKYDKRPAFVSLDVLKMRLVCRTFAEAGSLAFLNQVKKKHGAIIQYCILELPPRTGDLKQIEQVFTSSPKPSLFAPLITTINYHILCGKDEPDDEEVEFLFENMNTPSEAWYKGREEDLMEHNQTILRKQRTEQENFALQIAKPEELEKFRTIVNGMNNLSAVQVLSETFWPENSWGPPREDRDVAYTAYQLGFPNILAAVASSSMHNLRLERIGDYALGGLYPAKLREIGSSATVFKHVTSISLVFSHRDSEVSEISTRPVDRLGDRFTRLSRADRVNHLLYFMPNLQELTLVCQDLFNCGAVVDHAWLIDVFQGLKFSKLKTFRLEGF